MSNANEIVIHTYQTRELTGDLEALYGPSIYTYRRIAGVETARGTVLCRGIGNVALQRELLRLGDPDQVRRFVEFFADIIAPNDIRERQSKQRPEANYNCHAFAEAVAGSGEIRAWQEASTRVNEYVPRCREFRGRLPVGQIGFVLCGRYDNEILHSFIGLGEDTNECLSVLCVGGPVAIASYQNMLDDYITEFPQNTTVDIRE